MVPPGHMPLVLHGNLLLESTEPAAPRPNCQSACRLPLLFQAGRLARRPQQVPGGPRAIPPRECAAKPVGQQGQGAADRPSLSSGRGQFRSLWGRRKQKRGALRSGTVNNSKTVVAKQNCGACLCSGACSVHRVCGQEEGHGAEDICPGTVRVSAFWVQLTS